MDWADLHLHTHYSDGSDSPAEVVARAAAWGMKGLAITDHDTVDGLAEAEEAAGRNGLFFLRGVEISATFEGREVHIVGLGVDPASASLQECLDELRTLRRERYLKMAKRLAGLGIRIPESTPPDQGPGALVGRMHIARQLHEIGVTRTVQEGFERFLRTGRSAYAPKRLITVEKALTAIHSAQGLAFLGHPGLGKGLFTFLPRLLALPFDGMEVWHVSHNPESSRTLHAMAEERGLLMAGGSDCHGSIKGNPPEMGKVQVPWEAVARIMDRLRG